MHYRQNIPLSVREIGFISYGKRSYPSQIHWINGRMDKISLAQAPPELADCKTGQWIEAIVKRDPVTNHLILIDHIEKIMSLHRPSASKLAENWESLQKAELPKSEWEWPS
jgi:hypothetical protein